MKISKYVKFKLKIKLLSNERQWSNEKSNEKQIFIIEGQYTLIYVLLKILILYLKISIIK